MSENLALYERLRAVPDNAKKPISAGRLKGMTDISPMWRIKKLTEEFGACGFGWKYTVDKQWVETGADGVVMAFCNISLYVKSNGEWSEGIPGTGGASLVAKETKGLYSDDEAFKKALTDALSVACKALGMGADVYWDKDSKYNAPPQDAPQPLLCKSCGKEVRGIKNASFTYTPQELYENTGGLCYECYRNALTKKNKENNAND
jgi:hypothetical protein